MANAETSAASSTMTPRTVPTGRSCAPLGWEIFARKPSSMDSSAMVALSVSMSATTSPAAIASPSLIFHSAMFPWVIVGESAGMRSSCERGGSAG